MLCCCQSVLLVWQAHLWHVNSAVSVISHNHMVYAFACNHQVVDLAACTG
jgi:hypothetical protein